MINKVFLLGNLGKDAETKFTKDGTMITILRLATTEYVRSNGTFTKTTEWHTVVCFGKLAEFCAKLKKGDRIFVEGKLRTSSFEADNKLYRLSSVVAKSIKLIPKRSADLSSVESIGVDDIMSEDDELF